MSNTDVDAVMRHLDYIESCLRNLKRFIETAEQGEYSPLMSAERFEEKCAEALNEMGTTRKEICFGLSTAHRCSRCESLVEGFMKQQKDATVVVMSDE